MEFAEHKEYVPGDEIKHIDWKTSAKVNKLYIKKYEEEKNLKVLFLIDINPSFFQLNQKLDLLKEVFFILALSAIQNNDSISVLLWNNFINLKNSKNTFIKTLQKLDKVNNFDWDLSSSLEKIKKIKNHLIFILTDEIDKQNITLLRKLQIQNEIIYINTFHFFENNLLQANKDITFHYKNNLISVNLSDNKKIDEYKKLRLDKIKDFKQELIKSNIWYLYLDTEKNPYKEIYKFFTSKF